MKHVLVETNFLIEVTRPFQGREAMALLARARDGQVQLHLPWCSISEARRTLEPKIKEDLDFHGRLRQIAGQRWHAQGPFPEKDAVDRFAGYIEREFAAAMGKCNESIDAVARDCQRIDPSQGVLNELLAVYFIKSEKPFDEMVIAAVLHRASELHARGERDILFCNLNKKDFSAKAGTPLRHRYDQYGIRFQDNFQVP